MNFLIVLVVFAAIAYRVAKPDDRARYLALTVARLRELRAAAAAPRPDYDAFVVALRARSPLIVVVPTIVVLDTAITLAMLFVSGSASDGATLVRWGANLGTATTNGEWSRLLTAAFLQGGLFPCVVNGIVLFYVGSMAERLLGRAAVASVYLSAGVVGGLNHIASNAVTVGTSAASAICGIYGALAACAAWQMVHRRGLRDAELNAESADDPRTLIPPTAMKRIGVLGALLVLGALVDATAAVGALGAGFVFGAGCGLVIGYRAIDRRADLRAVGVVSAASAIAAVIYAMPLRNIADVKPELVRIVATETRTADAYKTAFDRFARQRLTADALADVADKTIVPELQAIDARLASLQHVPAEHQPIVADARDFLRLRTESWQARADALRRTHNSIRAAAAAGDRDTSWRVQAESRYRSSIAAAGKAEAAERAAADAFERVRTTLYSWRPIAE